MGPADATLHCRVHWAVSWFHNFTPNIWGVQDPTEQAGKPFYFMTRILWFGKERKLKKWKSWESKATLIGMLQVGCIRSYRWWDKQWPKATSDCILLPCMPDPLTNQNVQLWIGPCEADSLLWPFWEQLWYIFKTTVLNNRGRKSSKSKGWNPISG